MADETVFVVDDDADARDSLCALLESAGVAAEAARGALDGGERAPEVVRERAQQRRPEPLGLEFDPGRLVPFPGRHPFQRHRRLRHQRLQHRAFRRCQAGVGAGGPHQRHPDRPAARAEGERHDASAFADAHGCGLRWQSSVRIGTSVSSSSTSKPCSVSQARAPRRCQASEKGSCTAWASRRK